MSNRTNKSRLPGIHHHHHHHHFFPLGTLAALGCSCLNIWSSARGGRPQCSSWGFRLPLLEDTSSVDEYVGECCTNTPPPVHIFCIMVETRTDYPPVTSPTPLPVSHGCPTPTRVRLHIFQQGRELPPMNHLRYL